MEVLDFHNHQRKPAMLSDPQNPPSNKERFESAELIDDWTEDGSISSQNAPAARRIARACLGHWRSGLQTFLALACALCAGAAAVFFFAANWQDLGRAFKLALGIGPACALLAAGQWRQLRGKSPDWAYLGGFIFIGASLALIGQIYQTGADPWELFALWAALGLGLAANAQSQLLWLLQFSVCLAGALLFQAADNRAALGSPAARESAHYAILLAACCGHWLWIEARSKGLAGRAALRACMACALACCSVGIAASLFETRMPLAQHLLYWISAGAVFAAAWRLYGPSRPRSPELYLCAIAILAISGFLYAKIIDALRLDFALAWLLFAAWCAAYAAKAKSAIASVCSGRPGQTHKNP